jgi:hypothetical protein
MAKKSTPRSQADDAATAEAQPRARARTRGTRELGPEGATPVDSSMEAAVDAIAGGRTSETEQRRDDTSPSSGSSSMGSEPSEEDIRMRAYQRYVDRGSADGMHFEDWLEAERELRDRK